MAALRALEGALEIERDALEGDVDVDGRARLHLAWHDRLLPVRVEEAHLGEQARPSVRELALEASVRHRKGRVERHRLPRHRNGHQAAHAPDRHVAEQDLGLRSADHAVARRLGVHDAAVKDVGPRGHERVAWQLHGVVPAPGQEERVVGAGHDVPGRGQPLQLDLVVDEVAATGPEADSIGAEGDDAGDQRHRYPGQLAPAQALEGEVGERANREHVKDEEDPEQPYRRRGGGGRVAQVLPDLVLGGRAESRLGGHDLAGRDGLGRDRHHADGRPEAPLLDVEQRPGQRGRPGQRRQAGV